MQSLRAFRVTVYRHDLTTSRASIATEAGALRRSQVHRDAQSAMFGRRHAISLVATPLRPTAHPRWSARSASLRATCGSGSAVPSADAFPTRYDHRRCPGAMCRPARCWRSFRSRTVPTAATSRSVRCLPQRQDSALVITAVSLRRSWTLSRASWERLPFRMPRWPASPGATRPRARRIQTARAAGSGNGLCGVLVPASPCGEPFSLSLSPGG